MLPGNLGYPEKQFLHPASFPKEDTRTRHLWSSIHWPITMHQIDEKNPAKGLDGFKGSPHLGRLEGREETTHIPGSRAAGPRRLARVFRALWSHWKTHPPPQKDQKTAAFQKAEQWCRKRLPFRNCATGRAPGLLPPGSGSYLTS